MIVVVRMLRLDGRSELYDGALYSGYVIRKDLQFGFGRFDGQMFEFMQMNAEIQIGFVDMGVHQRRGELQRHQSKHQKLTQ